jgi:chorismate mutase
MTRLEAADMRFLRSVKGYTRLDKIRSEVIRKKTRDLWNTRRENVEEEEIVGALGNDGNASMPKQVNRPNPWRKMVVMMRIFNKRQCSRMMRIFNKRQCSRLVRIFNKRQCSRLVRIFNKRQCSRLVRVGKSWGQSF